MKALAKAGTVKKAVKDMNPVTQALRIAENHDEKARVQYEEAAKLIAAERDQSIAPAEAHPQLMKRAKAICVADGLTFKKNTWEKLSRFLILAMAGDLPVTVKRATSKADSVVTPANVAISTIPINMLSKAAQEIKAQWSGKAAPAVQGRAPRPAAPAPKTKADGDIKAAVKYWLAHAAERRLFEAVLTELGFHLAPNEAGATIAVGKGATQTKKGTLKTVRAH